MQVAEEPSELGPFDILSLLGVHIDLLPELEDGPLGGQPAPMLSRLGNSTQPHSKQAGAAKSFVHCLRSSLRLTLQSA